MRTPRPNLGPNPVEFIGIPCLNVPFVTAHGPNDEVKLIGPIVESAELTIDHLQVRSDQLG